MTAWYGVNTDISEQIHAEQALRRAETALRDLNAKLDRQVEERMHAVNEARAQAEAANRAKSDVLASMSHEIRTPLHGVLGYADLLGDTDTMTERQKKQLGRLQNSGAVPLTIVNDVLDFSKIEAGRFDLHAEPFAVAGLIDNAVSIGRSPARPRGSSCRRWSIPPCRRVLSAIRTGCGRSSSSIGLHILVAEDVEVNQEIIRAVLERVHHVVDIVLDGAGAVPKPTISC